MLFSFVDCKNQSNQGKIFEILLENTETEDDFFSAVHTVCMRYSPYEASEQKEIIGGGWLFKASGGDIAFAVKSKSSAGRYGLAVRGADGSNVFIVMEIRWEVIQRTERREAKGRDKADDLVEFEIDESIFVD